MQCSYLGTDPAMFTTPSAEVREIDYNEQDRELNSLQTIIKQKQQTTTGMYRLPLVCVASAIGNPNTKYVVTIVATVFEFP